MDGFLLKGLRDGPRELGVGGRLSVSLWARQGVFVGLVILFRG